MIELWHFIVGLIEFCIGAAAFALVMWPIAWFYGLGRKKHTPPPRYPPGSLGASLSYGARRRRR